MKFKSFEESLKVYEEATGNKIIDPELLKAMRLLYEVWREKGFFPAEIRNLAQK
ncbi:MAG: hypothetical protein J1E05_08005 [Eubacterium sp.]|nr:hypothetical protein [Eubacterium sp.]